MKNNSKPELKKQIQDMGMLMQPGEIADKLNIPIWTVRYHLGIKRKKATEMRASKNLVPEGCFNEHERENWLI